jgi:hypothetical protein
MLKQLIIEGTPHIICRHEDICIVTEIPTDGISIQQEKRYVKCVNMEAKDERAKLLKELLYETKFFYFVLGFIFGVLVITIFTILVF